MRLAGGFGGARCRRAAAGVVLAGAAMFGSLGAARAAPGRTDDGSTTAANDELAFAVPGPTVSGGGEVALPRPLPAADVARIRRIFALQAGNDGSAADQLVRTLDDDTLLGDLLADRFLQPTAHPTPAMLTDWLDRFGDHYEAPAIAALRHRLAPDDRFADPTAVARTGTDPLAEADGAGDGRSTAADARVEAAREFLARGSARAALLAGRDALARSNGAAGAGGFVAGLAAWQLGRVDQAGALFGLAERARSATAATRAGAAFWNARTLLARGNLAGYRAALRRAARCRGTFYGMLAARRLGLADWAPMPGPGDAPVLSEADVEAINALAAGRRAFALLQVGERARAEATLRHLWPVVSGDRPLVRSLMLVADAADMADLAGEIASALDDAHDVSAIAAGLKTPKLRPYGGFTVDPALVYALARVESDFDAAAVSDAGAHGMMQLEPVTAGYVIGDADRFTAHPTRLHDASLNLQLGQRYVGYLSGSTHVDGDLIRLLAAYNAGPNRAAAWSGAGDADDGDPLMFIETIPSDETRGFVHRSLSYLWIYAARLGLPSPSLDALAAGISPSYAPEVALAGASIAIH